MPGDKRVQRSSASVTALHEVLSEALIDSQLLFSNPRFTKSLKSQGSLAKYADPSRGIRPSSINTLKRIAEEVVPGGFLALDDLRKSAMNAFTREVTRAAPKRKTKTELLQREKSQQNVETTLREDLALLTFLLHRALNQGRSYAEKGDPSLVALCARERRESLDMLSLRKTPRATTKTGS